MPTTDLTPAQQIVADRLTEHLYVEFAGASFDTILATLRSMEAGVMSALFGNRTTWWTRSNKINDVRTLVHHTSALVHGWNNNSVGCPGTNTPGACSGQSPQYPSCLDAREAEATAKIEAWARWLTSRLYESGVDGVDAFALVRQLDVFGDKDYTLSARTSLEATTPNPDGPLRLRIKINTSSPLDVAAAKAYIDVLFGGPNRGPRRTVEMAA